MDLKQYDTQTNADAGRPCELVHPVTGKPLPGTPTLIIRGTDSTAYQAFVLEQKRVRLRKIADAEDESISGMIGSHFDPADVDAEGMEQLVNATIGWSGIEMDGADFPFSEANVRKLYAGWPWVKQQVAAFANDRANFLDGAASA